jgi:hypothetical protein
VKVSVFSSQEILKPLVISNAIEITVGFCHFSVAGIKGDRVLKMGDRWI